MQIKRDNYIAFEAGKISAFKKRVICVPVTWVNLNNICFASVGTFLQDAQHTIHGIRAAGIREYSMN